MADDSSEPLDAVGRGIIARRIHQDELPGVKLAWVTQLHVLPNGHVVVGNCHAGPANPQMVEVTRDKQVVWTFKDFKTFGDSLAAAQLLNAPAGTIR